MHSWTFRALILAALSAVALVGAGVGTPSGTVPAHAPDAFGGPLDAHAVVQAIPRDLTSSSRPGLQRVPCAEDLPGHTCFALRR